MSTVLLGYYVSVFFLKSNISVELHKNFIYNLAEVQKSSIKSAVYKNNIQELNMFKLLLKKNSMQARQCLKKNSMQARQCLKLFCQKNKVFKSKLFISLFKENNIDKLKLSIQRRFHLFKRTKCKLKLIKVHIFKKNFKKNLFVKLRKARYDKITSRLQRCSIKLYNNMNKMYFSKKIVFLENVIRIHISHLYCKYSKFVAEQSNFIQFKYRYLQRYKAMHNILSYSKRLQKIYFVQHLHNLRKYGLKPTNIYSVIYNTLDRMLDAKFVNHFKRCIVNKRSMYAQLQFFSKNVYKQYKKKQYKYEMYLNRYATLSVNYAFVLKDSIDTLYLYKIEYIRCVRYLLFNLFYILFLISCSYHLHINNKYLYICNIICKYNYLLCNKNIISCDLNMPTIIFKKKTELLYNNSIFYDLIIHSTYSNSWVIFIVNNNVICSISCGKIGFHKTHRSTYFAARQLGFFVCALLRRIYCKYFRLLRQKNMLRRSNLKYMNNKYRYRYQCKNINGLYQYKKYLHNRYRNLNTKYQKMNKRYQYRNYTIATNTDKFTNKYDSERTSKYHKKKKYIALKKVLTYPLVLKYSSYVNRVCKFIYLNNDIIQKRSIVTSKNRRSIFFNTKYKLQKHYFRYKPISIVRLNIRFSGFGIGTKAIYIPLFKFVEKIRLSLNRKINKLHKKARISNNINCNNTIDPKFYFFIIYNYRNTSTPYNGCRGRKLRRK